MGGLAVVCHRATLSNRATPVWGGGVLLQRQEESQVALLTDQSLATGGRSSGRLSGIFCGSAYVSRLVSFQYQHNRTLLRPQTLLAHTGACLLKSAFPVEVDRSADAMAHWP